MAEDGLGNPVSACSAVAVQGVEDFVSGFLGYETKAGNVMAAAEADPEAILPTIYAGWSWMFLEAAGARRNAARYLDRAKGLLGSANARERLLVGQLESWIAGDIPKVQAIGEEILRAFPRDLATMKLHQYHSFNRGDFRAMLAITEHSAKEHSENPHFNGMLAFGHEQLNNLDTAERAARKALRLKEKEPWAQHALAHVMLATGRVRDGIDFLDAAERTWVGLNSFMYTHNWWHKALFLISLGDEQAVFDAYDQHVWSMEKSYSQDQVNAISLLARMELAGMDVGPRWQELATWLAPRARDTIQPFLTIQYLYGLARAGCSEADTLMAAVEDKAMTSTAFDRLVWHDVALPGCRGVLAHARGDYRLAAHWLAISNPRIVEIGGSHAQRDLFEQLLLDARLKLGHWQDAHAMLEMRRIWDPDGVPLNRQLAEVRSHLGDDQAA
jgi:tetratricopeptide (TPR) repeat protein